MQRDIEPNEIDWVFCWRTSTGEVRAGARDTGMNGRRMAYRPGAVHPEAGLRTIVRGRVRTCSRPAIGRRLDEQGAISRASGFAWGHVTSPNLVPARDTRQLGVLRVAARAAVLSGDANEWAFAVICARERVCWAIHLAAPPAVVSDIARRLEAPRILEIREKRADSWVKGAQIFWRDLEGRVTSTLEADTFFDEAPLPALASSWRSTREERHRLSANWDKDPEILKEEMFGEWQERRPKGTQEQFELEWGLVTAVFGI